MQNFKHKLKSNHTATKKVYKEEKMKTKRNKKIDWRKPLIKLPEECLGENQEKCYKSAVKGAIVTVETSENEQCKEKM